MEASTDSRYRSLVALALTWAAGFVDALGYLLMSGVYTANMSGNTVLIGVHAVRGDASQLSLHATTTGTFVLGLLAAGVALRLLGRGGLRRLLAVAMALEALSLAALLALDQYVLPRPVAALDAPWRLHAIVAIAAIAMGIQNTSLRTAGVLTVYTTHVTGALTKFAEDAVDWLFRPRKRTDAAGRTSGGAVLFTFALWLAFLIGAFAAAGAAERYGMRALVAPIAVVLAVFVADCIRPLRRASRAPEAGGADAPAPSS